MKLLYLSTSSCWGGVNKQTFVKIYFWQKIWAFWLNTLESVRRAKYIFVVLKRALSILKEMLTVGPCINRALLFTSLVAYTSYFSSLQLLAKYSAFNTFRPARFMCTLLCDVVPSSDITSLLCPVVMFVVWG